jgi:hypothetical protein
MGDMSRYATPTFMKFLIGFLLIISAAFIVVIITSTYIEEPAAVDNVAQPR